MSNVIQIKHGRNVPGAGQLVPYELGIIENSEEEGIQYVKLVVGAEEYKVENLLDGSSTLRYYKDLQAPLATKANDKFFCRFQGTGSFKSGDFYLISLEEETIAGSVSAFESVPIQIDNNNINAMRVRKSGIILLSASVQMLSNGGSDDSGVYLYVYRNGEQIELCTSRALLKDAGALTIGMYIYEAQENDIFFIKAKNSTGVEPKHVSTYLNAALFEV